jgi:very-short-patch-repair endonuclease
VFETQKEFPPYFVDIWIPKLNLAVECDGVYWHNLPGVREKEQKRDRYLITRYKICIVRVPEKIIHDDPEQVISVIISLCSEVIV